MPMEKPNTVDAKAKELQVKKEYVIFLDNPTNEGQCHVLDIPGLPNFIECTMAKDQTCLQCCCRLEARNYCVVSEFSFNESRVSRRMYTYKNGDFYKKVKAIATRETTGRIVAEVVTSSNGDIHVNPLFPVFLNEDIEFMFGSYADAFPMDYPVELLQVKSMTNEELMQNSTIARLLKADHGCKTLTREEFEALLLAQK